MHVAKIPTYRQSHAAHSFDGIWGEEITNQSSEVHVAPTSGVSCTYVYTWKKNGVGKLISKQREERYMMNFIFFNVETFFY